MTTWLRFLGLCSGCALVAATATAQTNSTSSTPAQSATGQSSNTATRSALTTSEGDTGLWYVPTAEVLARGKWSTSGYRVALNYVKGFSNVADFPFTFAVGVFRGVEAFASVKVDTRIDRDLRPLFTTDPEVGGVVSPNPFVREPWTGDHFGDSLVGVKINLLSEARQKRVALAVRGSVKIPTGDKDSGVGSGKADSFLDVVVSKDVQGWVEIAGYGGGAFRGSPDQVALSNGLRWGLGAGFPSHGPLRFTTEFHGEKPFDETLTVSPPLVGDDLSIRVGASPLRSASTATLGMTWQHRNGVFLGAGASWSLPREDRTNFRTDGDNFGDFVDYQFRIGYHPGVGRYAPPPPPPPQAAMPPPPPPPPNRPPAFAQNGTQNGIAATKDGAPCDPCTVQPGQTITLSAAVQDPDGDTLTYRWTAPTGTFSTPTGATTQWTAPSDFEGSVPITVTASDGKGGTTSSTIPVRVVRPPRPVVELNFEDVYFDFDRSTLRPDALRLLDDAVTKLQASPGRMMIIEGHTCNIGTAEYNLALGDRRARNVQSYLTSRGVSASRLEIVSFGEERPKFDNDREETRRLNRRAALVVKVQ